MDRNHSIDYAKAVCIIFVVFVHTGFSILNNIFLFAMPMFFAATGYTFSLGKRSIGQNIVLRFKSIMLPFFLLMIFYTLIEMLRAPLFGYGDVRVAYSSLVNTFYGSGYLPFNGDAVDSLRSIMSYKTQEQTGIDMILPTNCHLWFLPAMFTAYTIFSLLVKFTKKNHLSKPIILFCLVLFASSEAVFPQLCQLPFGIGRGAIGAAFMLFGFWIKDYKLLENKSTGYQVLTNIIALIVYITMLLLGSDGSAFVRSYYGPYGVLSVFATFIGGSCGIWLLLSLCRLIERLPVKRVKQLLSYTGRNVMTVYLWHMAVKFLLDAVYICLVKASDHSMLDMYKMGLMPQNSLYFMIFEAIAVIGICLLFSKIINKQKSIEKV